jgi:16S rRNA (guanine966-N2)-methyltransferase
MRITAGQWRSRKLVVPEGMDVRPTSDKVRQAIFNILAGYGLPVDATVVDGFCGTGALGLEALSRGAKACTFMDKSKDSIAFARRNIVAMQADAAALLLQRDVLTPGPKPATIMAADLLFLDPPYRQGLLMPALSALAAQGWLAPQAVCVAECEKEAAAPSVPGFALLDDRSYGSTRIVFCRYEP